VTLENRIILYPPEHDSIRKITEALYIQAEALLNQEPNVMLATAQEKLTVNGHSLAAANPRNRKLALFLSQRGIVSVTLERGLAAQEPARLFMLLHELPPKTELQQYPSLAEALKALSHIRITWFELKSLRVQNQEQVEAPSDARLHENRWENIMHSGAAEPENTDFLRSLYALMPEFAPSLQERALAAPSDIPATAENEQLLAELRKRMPQEMIIALSMHALNDSRQISPALLKLLSSISLIQNDFSGGSTPAPQSGAIGADALQKLFERERYEDYVSPEYNDQLSALVRAGEADSGTGGIPSRIPGIQETDLLEAQTSRWLAKGLLGLMSEHYDDDIHRGCSEQLGSLIPDFLDRKDYDFLCTLFLALSKLELQNGQAAAAYARALREKYTDSAFVSRLNQAFLCSVEGAQKALDDLILLSGPRNIEWLLDLYGQSEDSRQQTRILKLLLMFKEAAAEAALNRINALAHKKVKTILRLITLCGGDPNDARLYPLLSAPETDVRMEAIRMFLSAGSPAPIPLLTGMLRSGNLATAVGAVRIAGEYKVKALSAELVRLLRTVYISDATAFRNRAIFENLNKIGDVSILPSLQKLAKARLSFTPGRLRATQEALSANLSGYPGHAIKWTLEGR
jgi:hypothetical protein